MSLFATIIYDFTRVELLVGSSWKTRAKSIFNATKTHALNLAKFVTLYKTMLLVQKKANGGKERKADTFIAGALLGLT